VQSYHQDERYIDAMGKYLSGQWAEADAAFQGLDEAIAGEAFIKLLRGNIAYSRGELEDAVARYREAIEARPDFGNAYYKLGVCLYRMGRLKQALEAFQSVVKMGDQSHAMAQYFVGLIHLFLGEDDGAATAFDGFHQASPESRIANFYLAQLKIKHKDFEEACVCFPSWLRKRRTLPKFTTCWVRSTTACTQHRSDQVFSTCSGPQSGGRAK
jgi:tetratricopeptide (TPR) repeat protein